MKNLKRHCQRPSGRERAWFNSRDEAERFATDPANHPAYLGDIAHECQVCGFWHLSPAKFLEPNLTHQDLNFLSECGIDVSTDVMKCAVCRKQFQENVEFLILRDGTMVHEECIP